MSNKTTKRALLSSVVALFLCCAMLMGTTYAWFTDEVTSENNVIKSGNLDVEFEYWNGTDWVDVAGKSDILTNSLWEPGVAEVAYLRVANAGSLALKYQLGINIVSEIAGVNAAGDPLILSEYIQFGVVEGVNGKTDAYENRKDAVAAVTEAKKLSAGYTKASSMNSGDELYLALVVWMPETVGNEANHNGTNVPQINLGLNIFATQMAAEEDSFGPDYDKDAWHTEMKVYTAADLQAALTTATAGTKIVLENDIVLTESIVIPATAPTTYSLRSDNAVKLDLNGKKITGTVGRDADGNRIHVLVNNGNLVIDGGTITSAGVNGGSAIYNAAGATMVINGTTINGAPFGDGAWPSYGINNYGELTVNGAIVNTYHGGIATGGKGVTVINYATVDVGLSTTTKQTSWALYNYENGQLTVNGGVFRNTKNENNKVYGGGYICPSSTGETIINGGIFDKTEADNNGTGIYYNPTNLVIKGGSFDTDPAKYIADGFKAVKHDDGKFYVVSENNASADLYISTADELKAFAAAVNNGNSFKNKTVVLLADIDLGGEVWTPVGIAHNKGFDGTFDGEGHTISNFVLTTSSGIYGAGFFGNLLGGAAIKNVTFDSASYATRSNVVGVVAGYLYGSATFENVHVTNADIRSFAKVGGILGMAADPGAHTITLTNCSVEGIIGGGYNVGGLIGLVLQGQTVNVTNCETDVVFYMDDGGYDYTYVKTDAGWMWNYNNAPIYAGVAEQYCYYDAEKDEFCMGEPVEIHFVVNENTVLDAIKNAADNCIIEAQGVVIELDGAIQFNKGATIVGATFKNATGTTLTQTVNGIFKDCVFDGHEAIRWCYTTAGSTVVFDNCVVKTDYRGVHFDGMEGDVLFKNCEINGFNAYSGSGTMTFENCTFGNDASKYNGLNIYTNTNLINCTFNFVSGKTNFIDMEGTGKTLTITNCTATLDGVEANIADFVGGSKLAENTVVYN